MHLVTYIKPDNTDAQHLGVLAESGQAVIDLADAVPGVPATMLGLIEDGPSALASLREALASDSDRLPLTEVRLLAPIPRPPRNVFCVGKNYREHAQEVSGAGQGLWGDADEPTVPIIFTKAPSAVIGTGAPIPASSDPTDSVDYEGELAVVIGAGGRGITKAEAMEHVFGYTILNDATSRRLQKEHQQWFIGKSLDGFCPMGPALVTRDEIPDVGALRVQTRVNDELRQDGSVSDLIFDIPTLIETLSRTMTLEPGDIIATGTPAGVGMGFKPPRYLHPGDRVAITIEPIGTLENPVG
ncbi:MAG TPA: fumarylacetoacetate hydrolase family protein [Gammaproteobacteria bacterium]|nr:fumarylacetoacetate hydrolase family protein [Gammaproteobacteria bacterium]